VGGTLADALTCNAVVKSFGAELREDTRLARVINRWRVRVRRTWFRYNYTAMSQLSLLLCLRASVIGGSVLLWMSGWSHPTGRRPPRGRARAASASAGIRRAAPREWRQAFLTERS